MATLHGQPLSSRCHLYGVCPMKDADSDVVSSSPTTTHMDYTTTPPILPPNHMAGSSAAERRESLLELRRSLQEILLSNAEKRQERSSFASDNRRAVFMRIGAMVANQLVRLVVACAIIVFMLRFRRKRAPPTPTPPPPTPVSVPITKTPTMPTRNSRVEVTDNSGGDHSIPRISPDVTRIRSRSLSSESSSSQPDSRGSSPRGSRRKAGLSLLKARFSRRSVLDDNGKSRRTSVGTS